MSATISIRIVDTDGRINVKDASAGITVAGDSGGGIFAGQIVTVTLNGKTYTGTIQNDGAWSVSVGATDLANLINGHAYTIAAAVTDTAGNTATAVRNVTVDQTAMLSITAIAADSFINAKNASAGISAERPQRVAHEYVFPHNQDEAKLAQIWEMVFGLPRVGVTDDFFELGGQRLIAAQLVSEVEKQFGATIDLSTLLVAPTIEQLALQLGKESSDSSSIVPLRASGDKIPLFCFHGGGGHLLEYHELAKIMPDDQPVYGVRAPDLDGAQQLMNVEELADRYLREIRDVQKSGPYHLCGLSFGGLLAYEVATKLASEGQKIGLLALFDTGNPAYYRDLSFARSLRFVIDTIAVRSEKYIRGITSGDVAAIGKYVREFFARRLDALRWNTSRSLSRAAGRPMPKAVRDNVRMFGAVGSSYTPKSFSGRLTLFRAKGGSAEYRHEPALGWDTVAQGGVDVLMVQGDHLSIMERPNVVDLGIQLSRLLNRDDDVQKGPSERTKLETYQPASAA
jgi:thioesterase domain-containing protein